MQIFEFPTENALPGTYGYVEEDSGRLTIVIGEPTGEIGIGLLPGDVSALIRAIEPYQAPPVMPEGVVESVDKHHQYVNERTPGHMFELIVESGDTNVILHQYYYAIDSALRAMALLPPGSKWHVTSPAEPPRQVES